MRLCSHPGASRDFDRAVDWYIAEAGKPAAARFVEEVEHLWSLILDNPRIGPSFLEDLKAWAFRLAPPDRDELVRAMIAGHRKP